MSRVPSFPGRPIVPEPARFHADWLRLREPVDHRSRNASVLRPLVARWASLEWTRILDLGSGTGSNLRYLAPRLPAPQSWTLFDHDAALLAEATPAPAGTTVIPTLGGLVEEGLEEVARSHLVTASALLDLVSEPWLETLASTCQAHGCGVLFALSYDGTIRWAKGREGTDQKQEDQDPDDEVIRVAVNAHQRRDKGLGRALGPRAAATAQVLLREHGYQTWTGPSPWNLGPQDAALVAELLQGWETAALEQLPAKAELIQSWARRKARLVRTEHFSLTVGHVDVLALPPSSGSARSGVSKVEIEEGVVADTELPPPRA